MEIVKQRASLPLVVHMDRPEYDNRRTFWNAKELSRDRSGNGRKQFMVKRKVDEAGGRPVCKPRSPAAFE